MQHTASEAAARLGVPVRRVQRWCAALGLPRHGRAYILSESDIERIRAALPAGVGNPNFGSRKAAMLGVRARKKLRKPR